MIQALYHNLFTKRYFLPKARDLIKCIQNKLQLNKTTITMIFRF